MHVALCDVAAVLTQRAQGGVVFDTVGDEVGSQAVSERHRRSHDRDGPGIERQSCDENLVQLQFVDGQILQPRQRRPPGPIVVKREAGAKTSQGGQARQLIRERQPADVGQQSLVFSQRDELAR